MFRFAVPGLCADDGSDDGSMDAVTIVGGSACGPVAVLVFKTSGTSQRRSMGSTPMRFRHGTCCVPIGGKSEPSAGGLPGRAGKWRKMVGT